MSIEEAALAVPLEQRQRFLMQAKAVEQRAAACAASPEELRIALAVLLVLCGTPASSVPS